MRKHLKWIIPLILIILIVAIYMWPVMGTTFEKNYARSDPALASSLKSFRMEHPPKTLKVDGVDWEYLAFGNGQQAILFLHGTTGAYDIWFQQMQALQDRYRVISVTYPAVNSLEKLSNGCLAVLNAVGVNRVHLVGTSLGGYLAQYIVAKHPGRVLSAVYSNTFPPNDILPRSYKTIGTVLPYLPDWVVFAILQDGVNKNIFTTSRNDEFTRAFLTEVLSGRMNKGQVVGRYFCNMEQFTAPDLTTLKIPALIIEADNDPLVEQALREQLKAAYPAIPVRTLSNGHFPYLNPRTGFTAIISDFITAHSQ